MSTKTSRVPYTQQFTPEQTPLKRLLPILRQNAGNPSKVRKAIAAAFFKDNVTPDRLARNTLIALRAYGILNEQAELTSFGQELIATQNDISGAHRLLAKHLLRDLAGMAIIETLREMAAAKLKIELNTLPEELLHRGVEASSNSSDLSGVLGWLRQASVIIDKYDVNESVYSSLIGTSTATLEILKNFSREQVAFLRAVAVLNVTEWIPYNAICKYAEGLYAGEVRYNWKDIVARVLKPLQESGLIEIRKKIKIDKQTAEGRGGKATDVRPTTKLDRTIAEPLLKAMYAAAGYADIRAIRSTPLSVIVADIEQSQDQNKRGKALEFLAIRLCQMLDLNFMGWRETDEEVAGGGEVDALLHSARLTYSRWQVQCKVGPVTLAAVAKEVGMKEVTLANVLLVVGTKRATDGAQSYRRKIISTSNLNIIFIDGQQLQSIIKDPTHLVEVLRTQAENALVLKPTIGSIRSTPPSVIPEQGPQSTAGAALAIGKTRSQVKEVRGTLDLNS